MSQYGVGDIAAEGVFSTEPYVLADAFLGRIKAVYRIAVGLVRPTTSPVCSSITALSQAVHNPLVRDDLVVADTPVGGLKTRKFGLIVNVDSVTEMTRPEADDYADLTARSRATVLSINHEADQHTATEMFNSMKRASRSPYWLRPGYLEELFTPARQGRG